MSILRQNFAWAASVVAIAFALYFATAARDIVVGDSPELIMAAASRGVAHPPGYPLFTIFGHLLSKTKPLGTIPFRVNLLAVICDALTVGLVYLTAKRLTRDRSASAIGALVLAVTPLFWSWSLAAEVFPLNNLLAALLILFLVVWYQQPERSKFLIAAAFVAGLGLTNHHTIILLGPAVCFLLWRRRVILFEQSRLIVFCGIAFACGLLPYIYVPFAASYHPAHSWGNISSLQDFIDLVSRKNYGGRRLVATPGYHGGSAVLRVTALCRSFGFIAGTLSIFGAIGAFRRVRWYFWFTLIAFLFAGPFFVWISNLNLIAAPSALFVLQRFFLLSHVVVAPLLAFGILCIGEILPLPAKTARSCAAALALVMIIASAPFTYRHVDLSKNHIARIFVSDVYQSLEPGTVLLATGDGMAFPLWYGKTVENLRPDITLVVFPLLASDWYVRQVRERYPDFNIPFDHYDGQANNLNALLHANRSRTFAIIGAIEDQSIDAEYWPYPHGIVSIVQPKSDASSLQQIVADNEQLLARYHVPDWRTVRHDTFETDILNAYAWPAFRVGLEHERVGDKPDARQWYERALNMNPNLPIAREALGRVR